MAYCILKFNNAQRSRNTRWQPTRRATASVLPGAQRLPADCFCRHRLRLEAIALGISWVGWHNPEAPSLAAAKGIQDTAVDLVSEEVTWLVLVWFGRQSAMKYWVCDGLDFFLRRRRTWSRLCQGPLEVALRLLLWSITLAMAPRI